jgi:integrase
MRRRSTRRPPAQLSIALDANGAGDVGARSGGTEHDAAPPALLPSVAAPELRYGLLAPAHPVNPLSLTAPPFLDGSAAACSSAAAGRARPDDCEAVNDAEDLEQLEDLAGAGGALEPARAQLVDLVQLVEAHLDRVAAEKSPAAAYLEQLAPGSQKAMREALSTLVSVACGVARSAARIGRGQRARASSPLDAHSFPWGKLRYAHALVIRETLVREGYAPKSINRMLAALRGTMREAFKMGLYGADADEYARALSVRNVQGGRRRRPRIITPAEWRALFDCCDSSARGRRTAAFLVMLRQGGLRDWEAAGVDVADYEPATGALYVARGKGDKQRTVWISHEGKEAIAAWLELRGTAPGPLLCPVDRLGRVQIQRPTTEALRQWWHDLAAIAGVPSSWPHCARATAITEIAERDGAHVAQQYAGHARLDQTGDYIQLGADRLRAASEGLRVPFKR